MTSAGDEMSDKKTGYGSHVGVCTDGSVVVEWAGEIRGFPAQLSIFFETDPARSSWELSVSNPEDDDSHVEALCQPMQRLSAMNLAAFKEALDKLGVLNTQGSSHQ